MFRPQMNFKLNRKIKFCMHLNFPNSFVNLNKTIALINVLAHCVGRFVASLANWLVCTVRCATHKAGVRKKKSKSKEERVCARVKRPYNSIRNNNVNARTANKKKTSSMMWKCEPQRSFAYMYTFLVVPIPSLSYQLNVCIAHTIRIIIIVIFREVERGKCLRCKCVYPKNK